MKLVKSKFLIALCFVTLSSLFLTGISASANTKSDQQDVSQSAFLDPEVTRALQTSNEVNVIVSLSKFEVSELSGSQKQIELSQEQNGIINQADLDVDETRAYDRIPAIAATVNLEQLEALRSDPSVQSIRLSNYYTPQSLSSKENSSSYTTLNEAIPMLDADDAWSGSTSYTGDGKRL